MGFLHEFGLEKRSKEPDSVPLAMELLSVFVLLC